VRIDVQKARLRRFHLRAGDATADKPVRQTSPDAVLGSGTSVAKRWWWSDFACARARGLCVGERSEPTQTKLARRASEVWLGVRDGIRNWLLTAAW